MASLVISNIEHNCKLCFVQGYLYNRLRGIDQALKETKMKREKLKVSGRECCRQACTLWKFKRKKSYFHDFAGRVRIICITQKQ